MKFDLTKKTPDQIEKILSEAYMNLIIDDEDKLYNPLLNIPEAFDGQPELYITGLLANPDFFTFTCKEILGVNIIPMQAVILKELWIRKFPMLIGSRGLSKSFSMAIYCILLLLFQQNRKIIICGTAFRQSKIIFQYIEQIINNSPILRSIFPNDSITHGTDSWTCSLGNSFCRAIPIGCLTADSFVTTKNGIKQIKDLVNGNTSVYGNTKFRDMGFFYDSGITENINVKTKHNYEFTSTPNHKMKMVRNKQVVWVRADEMVVGDRILIDRSIRWHEGDTDVTVEDAYFLGRFIGSKDTSTDLLINLGEPQNYKDEMSFKIETGKTVADWMKLWELSPNYNKILPEKLLSSSKDKVAACIQGLFDTGGLISVRYHTGIFKTKSVELYKQLQYILLHFGIISNVVYDPKKYVWHLNVPMETFEKNIGFKEIRHRDDYDDILSRPRRFNQIEDLTTILKSRTCVALKDIVTPENFNPDLVNPDYFYDTVTEIKNSGPEQTYDINIPDGNEYCSNGFFSHNTGEKIRGQRATNILNDEFGSILIDIFETVIAGFAAVSAAPDKIVKNMARFRLMQRLSEELAKVGIIFDNDEDKIEKNSNQIVISGTATYDYNHFSRYHKTWLNIIKSRGDQEKLKSIFGETYEEGLNWKDYSVIRIPISAVPEGFMDEGQINRSKTTMTKSTYVMEFEAGFISDSDGFFRNSLIQQCTVNYDMCIALPSGRTILENEVFFEPELYGNFEERYVYGVDPASKQDNFSIVIIKLCNGGEYRKIVHVWVTNDKDHKEKVKLGLVSEHNFYAYCAKKLRQLMKTFPPERIALDSQGGGAAIVEALRDKDKIPIGERAILPTQVFGKPKDTDVEDGEHIIELINFASQEWISTANHGMKKDFEDRVLLFPFIDAVSLAIASSSVALNIPENEEYEIIKDDTESLLYNIEELKLELITIAITETPSGREHFDTPEVKTGTARKGRMKKDRYSALLMANAVARTLAANTFSPLVMPFGGFSNDYKKNDEEKDGILFQGPANIIQQMQALYE